MSFYSIAKLKIKGLVSREGELRCEMCKMKKCKNGKICSWKNIKSKQIII